MRKGERVEVRSDDIGFLGSWYEATLLTKSSKSSKTCLVRYKTLVGDRSEEPLQERVPAALIRPVPPIVAVDKFDAGDAVEVYDRDGWWVGNVTKAIPEQNKYAVYFRESREEEVYELSQLRLRQDWHDGIWIRVYEKQNQCLQAFRQRLSPSGGKPQQIRGFAGLKRRIMTPDEDDAACVVRLDSEESDQEQADDDLAEQHLELDYDNNNNNNNSNKADISEKLPSKSPPADGIEDAADPEEVFASEPENPIASPGLKRKATTEVDDSGEKCRLRRIQHKAYGFVLRALRSKASALTWKQEQFITDLRHQLDIDIDVHLQKLEALDGLDISCDCSYCRH